MKKKLQNIEIVSSQACNALNNLEVYTLSLFELEVELEPAVDVFDPLVTFPELTAWKSCCHAFRRFPKYITIRRN